MAAAPGAFDRLSSASRWGLRLFGSQWSRKVALWLIAVALVPMVVVLTLSLPVLENLSNQHDVREREALVRTMAGHIRNRLVDAREMVGVWPDQMGDLETGIDPGLSVVRTRLPGLGWRFQQAALLGPDGTVLWATAQAVANQGQAMAPSLAAVTGRHHSPDGHDHLLVRERNGQVQLMLVSAPRRDGSRWLAELNEEDLWLPMMDGAQNASWCVQDGQGLHLFCPVPRVSALQAHGDFTGADASERVHTGWTLSLQQEFGAGQWQFDMVTPRSHALFASWPLGRLGLAAVAGVLLMVFLGTAWLVRSTLRPLQQLHVGLRQVAQRESGVRVQARGRDEVAELGRQFNDMSERVDEQFQALELLASIDRDIVSHRAVDDVFRRVLIQGVGRLGVKVMALVRLEADRVPRMHLLWNDDAQPHKVHRQVRAMSPAEYQSLVQVQHDTPWPPEGHTGQTASGAWFEPLMGAGQVLQLRAFPLCWQGQTYGLMLLGSSPDSLPLRLREVQELRDRLCVALVAYQRERVLTRQARHDDLTGLLNRNGLHQDLDELLQDIEAHTGFAPAVGLGPAHFLEGEGDAGLAVLFIDLDHFKTVNDSLGHGQGDELLRQAADRLEACAPTRAVAARPGGDEFVLVLPGVGMEEAVRVAAAICHRMALPFILNGKEYFLGASIGIAVAPLHGTTRSTLLRHADMAMYTAKEAGRGRYAVFEEPLDTRVAERSSLLADLRHAIERKELALVFQPRVSAKDSRIVSAEALIRWHHPTRGWLSPGVFIPLAEESDLIERIGLWVLQTACAQMAQWQREGVPLRRVSVNVSPRQLQSGQLIEQVNSTLAEHGVPCQMLELEVTESLLVGDAREASEQLSRLRERGILIALDDFGTGYSSMATLRNLPVDVMKVDRAFVQDIHEDASALAVTRAILTLAQSLGKHTVAEGIETPEQAQMLRELGCHELQGYWFSKPLPAQELAALCRRNQPLGATVPQRPKALEPAA